MSLIDGIGDEVTEFFLLVTIICIGLAAWWSTAINHRLRIRTVLILEHRSSTNQNTSSQVTTNNSDQIVNNNTILSTVSASTDTQDDSSEIVQTIDDQEQQTIVHTMDAPDTSTVRQRRLAYFQENATTSSNTNSTADIKVESASCSTSENTENLNETNAAMSSATKDVCDSSNKLLDTKNRKSETCIDATDGDLIRIKLKYLNDDIKSVEGKKCEKLGDFKRRHFEVELAACKLVRLIFNGQVLQKDSETLQDCGLFDNCVVHCLIHQRPQGSLTTPANQNTQTSSSHFPSRSIFSENSSTSYMHSTATNSNTNSPGTNGERENATLPWDLGNVLLALISLILCGAWYFRFEYAQLFTVTATVFLMCLTGIFTLLLIGLLYPDHSGVQSSSGTTSTTPTS